MLSRYVKGDPRYPPCVFLHGFLGVKEDWKEMWDELSSHFFCIGFDLPGHGKSPPISSDYLDVLEGEITSICPKKPALFTLAGRVSAGREVPDVATFDEGIAPAIFEEKEATDGLLAAGRKLTERVNMAEKPILIGYSLGGRIALQLAERHPEAYSHVILLSSHPGLKEEEKQERLSQDLKWIDKLKSGSMEAFLKEWYAQPLFNSLHKRPELLHRLIEERKSQDPQKMADVFWMLSPARQSAIASFPPRTLFLYGEEDEKYQKIYSALPKEGIVIRKIECSGHPVHLENPKSCVLRILEWLRAMRI